MRRVVWSERAQADYLAALRHIADDDPEAAARVGRAIQRTGEQLGEFATGYPGRITGTYEKSVRRFPYIIAYTMADDGRTVAILRVIHTSRDWREDGWPD
jgi:toxin ParE1/3/4